MFDASNKRDVPAGKVSATKNLFCLLSNLLSNAVLSYAVAIVILLSSEVSVKLVPTIFFNLDVVVFNNCWLPVIDVPLLILPCLSSSLPLIDVKN